MRIAFLLSLFSLTVHAGVELSGRLAVPRTEPPYMLAAVRAFGFSSASGKGSGFRTWEMEPRGWWKLDGAAGDWNVLFTGPAGYVRPCLLATTMMEGTKHTSLRVSPFFDYTCFAESAWDTKPARTYWQPFTAVRTTSVTHVGFKLATDGVDGPGPGSQTLVLSIHRCTDGPPDTWPQVGPAMSVPGVDCGGAKSYHYSAGWHSGEVKLEFAKRYAVKLRAEKEDGVLQAFWEKAEDDKSCQRADAAGIAPAGHRLWMTVSGDGDDLLIPCNKRVHREFGDFAGYTTSWTQTWRAAGTSLCGVMLYTATSGTQPAMDKQRIAVRIHRGGPDGPVVSEEKTAAVSANYTGDASWGVIAAVYARGAVVLTPGETYAAEFTTLETPESIGDFVNFKKQVNDRKPGFNPYYRPESDPYDAGEAWKLGKEKVARDLDVQVVEYDSPMGKNGVFWGDNGIDWGDVERKFYNCKTDRERLLNCMDLMERKIIFQGKARAPLENLFKDRIDTIYEKEDGRTVILVALSEQLPPAPIGIPVPRVGWFLHLTFSKKDMLEECSLFVGGK